VQYAQKKKVIKYKTLPKKGNSAQKKRIGWGRGRRETKTQEGREKNRRGKGGFFSPLPASSKFLFFSPFSTPSPPHTQPKLNS
jgi:hypothetical protein